jgi:MFS family permease
MIKNLKKKERTDEEIIYLDTMYATDTASAAIKNSVSGNFIVPFVLALGAPISFIPIVSSVPELIGSFVQLYSSKILNLLKNRKKLIVLTSLIDSLLWLPILLIPYVWNNNYYLLLSFLIIQSISLSILRPVYNSLLGDILKKESRGKVLGKINYIAGAISFVSTLIFGYLLKLFNVFDPILGFTIVFFIAFISRSISSLIKTKFHDPEMSINLEKRSIRKFIKELKGTYLSKFLIFNGLYRFGVGVSASFFVIYMLNTLKLGYFTYTLLSSASVISSFLIVNRWGSRLDKKGSKSMIEMSSFMIPIIPLLWVIIKNPIGLFFIQLLSGAAWSGFNLAISNFIMDETNSKNRLLFNSIFEFFKGIMTFLGSLFGILLVNILSNENMALTYTTIFAISGVIRLAVAGYYIPQIVTHKTKGKFKGPMTKRIVGYDSGQGALYEYVPRRRED